MHVFPRFLCCAALSILPVAWLHATGEPAETQQPFRTGVAVVRVDVLVMDGSRPVAGLTSEDFELRDSGVVQQIQAVTIADIPISVMLALDTSSSVDGPPLIRLKDAALAALGTLRPEDRSALLTFSGAVRLRRDWGPPSVEMRTAIADVRAGGSTSLFDAAFSALTLRDPVPGNRSLVILFSDGADTSSWLPEHAALDRTRRTDAVVYAAAIRGAWESRLRFRSGIQLRDQAQRSIYDKTPFIEELASLTGGKTFIADGANRLRETFTDIVTEFRSRYLLTYVPEGVDSGGWHPLEVRLKEKKGRVTARRGYDR